MTIRRGFFADLFGLTIAFHVVAFLALIIGIFLPLWS